MEFKDKVAVVTGAGSGIGRAIAGALTARGAQVILADIDVTAALEVARSLGSRISVEPLNVRDPEAIERFAAKVWEKFDGIDLVFANAGIAPGGPLLEVSPQQFDVLYEVNVRGSWATCAAFARLMIGAGRSGALCVTGSEHSLGMQHTQLGLYTASKHAVLGWADVLRRELPQEITLSILCPGVVNTQLYDATRNTELPHPKDEEKAFGRAVMQKGMAPDRVAETCLAGVAEGLFFIPTHASSFHAVRERFDELQQSFARYAPQGTDSEKYRMEDILADVAGGFAGSE